MCNSISCYVIFGSYNKRQLKTKGDVFRSAVRKLAHTVLYKLKLHLFFKTIPSKNNKLPDLMLILIGISQSLILVDTFCFCLALFFSSITLLWFPLHATVMPCNGSTFRTMGRE